MLLNGILEISNELSRIRALLEDDKASGWRATDQVPVVEQNNRWESSIKLNFDDYARKQQIGAE